MSDKTPADEQWDTLVDDWQSQPYEKVDTAKLVKQLKKRTAAAKAVLVIDVLATLGVFIGFIWAVLQQPLDMPLSVFLGVCAVGSLIYTIIEFKIRIATWKMDATNPQAILNKNISALHGAIQYANLWIYSYYMILPLVNWFVWEVGKAREKDMLLGYVYANGLVIVMLVAAFIFRNKRQRELDNLKRLGL